MAHQVVEQRARVAGQVGGVERHRGDQRLRAVRDGGLEQGLLVTVVVVDRALVRARLEGDPVHPAARQAVRGELSDRRLQQVLTGRRAVPGHAQKLTELTGSIIG